MADQGERADMDSFLHPLERRAALLSVLRALQWSCPTSILQNCSSHLQVSIKLRLQTACQGPLVCALGHFLCQEGKKVEESSLIHTISGNPSSHPGKQELQLVPLDRCED